MFPEWGFPEWGFSYNALYVPLGYANWHCGLLLEREVLGPFQTWNRLSFDDDTPQRKRGRSDWSRWDNHGWWDDDEPMENRIARDRGDFLQMFNVRIDRREAYMSRDFDEYVRYIREHLRLSSWDLPGDGTDITRILKQAVRDGRFIPAINRNWSGNRSVFRQYAPQYWPASGGGYSSSASEKVLSWNEFQALRRANGEVGGSRGGGSVFDLSSKAMGLDAAASASDRFGATVGGVRSAGKDWLGTAIEVAGGVLGQSDTDKNPLLKGFTDADSPLSDADPYEFEPSPLSDDVFDIAARGVKMTGNEPGGFRLNPSGLDTDYFDSSGTLSAQYHESHGEAHGHNVWNGKRELEHLPMSPIRWK